MTGSGVICVYKEAGWTSFDVVAKLRSILGIKKIGHSGTLDPDATGVLPICFGKATKLVEEFSHSDKIYETTLLLGVTTDTQDISGNVVSKSEDIPNKDEIIDIIKDFIGSYRQIPPMYSAKKIKGKRLYELAREGKEVERKPVEVKIYDIKILSIDLPRVEMRVSCSSGTYIRTLCNDIGDRLGCGGCMERLIRTRVNMFTINEAIKLDEIKELIEKNEDNFIRPIDSFFKMYKRIDVKGSLSKIVKNGGIFGIKEISVPKGKFRVYLEDGRFVGIYENRGSYAKPHKIFLE